MLNANLELRSTATKIHSKNRRPSTSNSASRRVYTSLFFDSVKDINAEKRASRADKVTPLLQLAGKKGYVHGSIISSSSSSSPTSFSFLEIAVHIRKRHKTGCIYTLASNLKEISRLPLKWSRKELAVCLRATRQAV